MRASYSLVVATAAMIACQSEGTDPDLRADVSNANSGISITTAKTAYDWAEISTAGELTATVINNSDQSVFVQAGDGFAGPIQEDIYIAEGSDARVERGTQGGGWVLVPGALLIEGVRVVELRAKSTYRVRGTLAGARASGNHRIRLEYFSDPTRSANSGRTAWSPEFVVR